MKGDINSEPEKEVFILCDWIGQSDELDVKFWKIKEAAYPNLND